MATPAWAQREGEVLEAVVEGLPERFRHAEATARGDLMLGLGPEGEAPMMRVIALRSAFERELIKFGQGRWGERGVDHVVEGKDRSVWAIGAREVLTGATERGPWRRIGLDPLEERACLEWEQYGTHCQEIIPLGGGRGIVLRPAYSTGADGETVLGTQVVVVAADKDEALGSIALPGLLLGPSVSDGQGGFWVMIRRPQKLSNSYKPLRGYLHFASEGTWQMWNNSKEQLDDVEYKGLVPFEIVPEPRKMAPDGQGGFFAVGRPGNKLYHVDADGEAVEFGPPQVRCQYCKQLAIAWDEQSQELHLLTAQWRDGDRRQLFEDLRWWRLDARGQVIAQGLVPGGDKRDDFFYNQVQVRSNNGSTWVLGPKLWAHHDGRVWTTLKSGQAMQVGAPNGQANGQTGQGVKKAGGASDEQLAAIGLVSGIGMLGVGMAGSYFLAPEDERATSFYVPMFGMMGAYLPAMLLPQAGAGAGGAPPTWGCLGSTFIGLTLATGLATWGGGEVMAARAYEDVASGESLYSLQYKRLGGSLGGAALGSLASVLGAHLIYGDEPDANKDAAVLWMGIGLTAGLSSLGYFLFATEPAAAPVIINTEETEERLVQREAQGPMIGTSFTFTW
jgi:hypothetical protein